MTHTKQPPGNPGRFTESVIGSVVESRAVPAVGGRFENSINLRLAEEERTDLGNAERLIARAGPDVLFVRDVGWHVWDGRRWQRDGADDQVRRKAQDVARAILEEVEAVGKGDPEAWGGEAAWKARRQDLYKWFLASSNTARITAMIAEAKPQLSVGPADMDADPHVINLENGTLRLEGACEDLRPHERGDRLAKMMPVAFDAEATCPKFDAFLAQVQPDPAVRTFLQRWVGYCMTGDTSEQKLVFNYGEGGNGKSVFTDLIARILGPYSVSLPFASLLRDNRKRGSDATPDLARLPGARLVRASEPERGSRFAEATIKAITGGEPITARHLNHGFFDFTPQFKLMLSGNHKPAIRGQDHGIWRRFLLVPWGVNLGEEEQDKTLSAKLWKERTGVLNWMLDGARLWLDSGLDVPERVLTTTEEYRADSDPLGRFMAACLEAALGEWVGAAPMHQAFSRWCEANAERPWTKTTMGTALRERGIGKRTVNGRIRYIDVRLVNVPDADTEVPEDDL